MAIKRLQNNFTTPKQSKRLLELGVPADSADCIYLINVKHNYTLEILKNITFHEKVSEFDELYGALPCWSVGRLMEIIVECYQVDMQFCYFIHGGMIESLINTFIELKGEIDFSKLEE